MSAFAVIYNFSNTPVEPGVLERVMERLKYRGPDGNDVWQGKNSVLGHLHLWTTPEELGERQPLRVKELPYLIVFDGRLDNRAELLDALKLNDQEDISCSDACLVLRAFDRWGKSCFERFIGEFALVILDEPRHELFCARDALGERTLFYSAQGTHVVIASEPWAVTGADSRMEELNESAIANYFAMQVNENGATLFKNVYELLPGHGMHINGSGLQTWRYWQPNTHVRLRGLSDQEYAQQFIHLLDESVRCRMRSTTPPGVLMSGGLDSGSVACLAARQLDPAPLTTLSYVFDELTNCDERQYITAIQERWNLNSIQVPCDDAWPWKDRHKWPRNPNHPEKNAYRLVKERIYRDAQNNGVRVLLTGMYGDELYGRGSEWLADLIMDGKYSRAVHELYFHLRRASLTWNLRAGYLQGVGRRMLEFLPGGRHVSRRTNPAAWLTSFSADSISFPHDPGFDYQDPLLGLQTAQDCSTEILNASRYELELRHPYRDRRLVEFVLGLPAYQLYKQGYYKYVLRVGMCGLLPEIIRTRYQPTHFRSLLRRGMEREKKFIETRIHSPDAVWHRFVKPEWLLAHWQDPITDESGGTQFLVTWSCIAYENWLGSSIS